MQGKHKLRDMRDDRRQTQRALGARAGVSPSTICNIECHRGPDVPRTELHKTKTRLSTALKLTGALSELPPGTYSLEKFVELQNLFTEAELYEALVNQREREQRRRTRKSRHQKSVA